ncbi:uncharacterized protein LOC108214555 isoform X2 [Daucus carota subsp. sativus]|uniref:uncharacterized protein LOC108214555 isoform X2 n=1 Tax=Daucus carota subsp. sativus TaxID=79200 RepID=UPI0030836B9B
MNSTTPELLNEWIEVQSKLKRKLVTEDDFTWKLASKMRGGDEGESCEVLKYVGGVDLSFSKEEQSVACATLVVLDLKSLEIVYQDSLVVRLSVPYVPGFLAFREAPVLLELLDKMKACSHPFYPQLLMVDGNGILHPQGFGLACHLGVLANIPTIGIGKSLHHVDGLSKSMVRELFEMDGNSSQDIIPLVGDSGQTLGAGQFLFVLMLSKGDWERAGLELPVVRILTGSELLIQSRIRCTIT